MLLDQLSSYEAWWHAHQRLHVFAEPAYEAALGRFLAPHRELAQYREWWITTRRTVIATSAIEHVVTDWARPANLRSADWLDRYLAAMPTPVLTRQDSERQCDEPWPY